MLVVGQSFLGRKSFSTIRIGIALLFESEKLYYSNRATLTGLVEVYVRWRQEDVDLGNITKGRLSTIKSQLNVQTPSPG